MKLQAMLAACAAAAMTAGASTADAQGYPNPPSLMRQAVQVPRGVPGGEAPTDETDDYARLSDSADYGRLGKPPPFTDETELPRFARDGFSGHLTVRLSEKLVWLRNACLLRYNLAIQTDPEAVRQVKSLYGNMRASYYEIRAVDPNVLGPFDVGCLRGIESQDIAYPNGAVARAPVPPEASRVATAPATASAGLTMQSTVGQLLADPTTRAILARDVPEVVEYRDQAALRDMPMDRAIMVFFEGSVTHARLHTLRNDISQAESNYTPPPGSQQGKVVHF